MQVQITILADNGNGFPTIESRTLEFGEDLPLGWDRSIGDTARILGQKAVIGHQLPTPKREGGRA